MRPVLVTRTAPGAEKTAARVAQAGFEPVMASTASIRPLPMAWPEDAAVLALTSPNGAARAGALATDKTLPVFAVGDTTAEAARQAGFRNVVSASGDGAALAALIADSGPPGPVLHIRGADQAFDLVEALTAEGLEAISRVAYAAETVDHLPKPALDALQPGAVVLIHSAKGASRFVALVRQAGLQDELEGLRAVAISRDAAIPLRGHGFSRIDIAASPDEEALIAALCAAA
jgi:uroporphyrinogen-III synthase